MLCTLLTSSARELLLDTVDTSRSKRPVSSARHLKGAHPELIVNCTQLCKKQYSAIRRPSLQHRCRNKERRVLRPPSDEVVMRHVDHRGIKRSGSHNQPEAQEVDCPALMRTPHIVILCELASNDPSCFSQSPCSLFLSAGAVCLSCCSKRAAGVPPSIPPFRKKRCLALWVCATPILFTYYVLKVLFQAFFQSNRKSASCAMQEY